MTTLRTDATAIRTIVVLGFLWLLLAPVPLRADPVEQQDVVATVETWVRYVTADARPDAAIERLEAHVVEGRTLAYIAHFEGGGFCLCGGDDLVLPVYLYSPNGTYDPDNPDNRYILWEIGARLTALKNLIVQRHPEIDKHRDALGKRKAYWTELIARRAPAPPEGGGGRDEPEMMVLPLTTTWGQGHPWNIHCPLLTPDWDEHTLTGCVATAMAQIMCYWKWPASGQGSDSGSYHYYWRPIGDYDTEPLATDPGIPANWAGGRLRWTATNGGQLEIMGYWDGTLLSAALDISDDPEYHAALLILWSSALTEDSRDYYVDFGAATYDWDIMPDHPTNPNDPGAQEVAKIGYHAGVSLDMDYGVDLSSAFTSWVPASLCGNFGYDGDAHYDSRNIYVMVDEIQWLRPLQFRAERTSDGAGHSWVVYGYNTGTSPTQFLMNFGWGGSNDGWYSCDDINTSNGDWNDEQYHVKQIAPASVVRFVDYGTSGGDGSPGDPYQGLAHALQQAPDDTTLIMKAGSTHVLSGDSAVIDKPIILKGYDVILARE